MTIDDIADFCQYKDCTVAAGGPETGFIRIDGTGLENRAYTWNRFSMLHEVNALPSPAKALEKATIFRISKEESTTAFNREEFERMLEEFQAKVGA